MYYKNILIFIDFVFIKIVYSYQQTEKQIKLKIMKTTKANSEKLEQIKESLITVLIDFENLREKLENKNQTEFGIVETDLIHEISSSLSKATRKILVLNSGTIPNHQ